MILHTFTRLICAKNIIGCPSQNKLVFKCLSTSFSSKSLVLPENEPSSDPIPSSQQLPDLLKQNETHPPALREEVLNKYLKPKRNYVPLFNLAAYVNKNSTLQEFVKLGVNLHIIELKKGAQEIILKLDFERDVKKYLLFLHDVGVPADELGSFITRNPFIFKEDLEDLQVRINYLESMAFTPENITRILTKNPRWLLYKTQNIDERLGYFQTKFMLKGPEVRHVAVRMPKIVTYKQQHIEENYFAVKEEMGFESKEVKELILQKPKIYTINRTNLVERFDYLHNTMGITHRQLVSQPGTLLCRQSKLKERHEFLKSIGKDIFDPSKPGYISPLSIVAGTDQQFCTKVAKTSVTTYNRFLKTLC
ncbi:transcription termination factor 3, mitochondrial [Halyomorpha halys]|uniref:transcription termination factor 3, mitochondrial n=1 Tax=Halyomorpha halys TaxID=286706 RepID=UPI0006D4DBB5|nr:transcription termination factor 3, mitochondrial [Halyomorpha halys]